MDRTSSTAEFAADPTDALESIPTSPPAGTENRIDRETEAVIEQYFQTFNAGDFAATAALFAPEGALYPPFESAVVGQDAIAAYLEQEAQGMKLELRQCVQDPVHPSETEIKVAGKVQTPLFGVNVRWTFLLNDRREILSVQIKLLAALEDLLKLKQ